MRQHRFVELCGALQSGFGAEDSKMYRRGLGGNTETGECESMIYSVIQGETQKGAEECAACLERVIVTGKSTLIYQEKNQQLGVFKNILK